MFARPGSFSVLYGIQRCLLTAFYLVSVIALFWLMFYLLHEMLGAGGRLIVPVSIAYLVLVVIGYSIIHVIAYIPSNLAGAFDPLKNGIAGGNIVSARDFAGKLADFLCSFFNFTFFDLEHSLVLLNDRGPVPSSNLEVSSTDIDVAGLKKFAESIDRTTFYGKVRTGDETLYWYVVPLVFGERSLGYMAVAARHRLWGIFLRLLDEFENDFVDDQVVHVLAREDGSIP